MHVRMLVDGVFTWGRERNAEVARSPHPEPGVSAKVAPPMKIDHQKPQFWMATVARARSCIEQAPLPCQTGQASVGIVPAQPSLGTSVPLKSSLLAAQSLPAL